MTSSGENTGAVGVPLRNLDRDELDGHPPVPRRDVAAGPEQSGHPLTTADQTDEILPTFVYQLHFAGGVFTLPAATAQAVIDLTPGDYVVWGDDPTAPQAPVALSVTGDFPQDVPEPASDVTATLIDFAITIEGSLTAGKHIMKVQHQGAQPHFLEIDSGPDTMTKEQVQASFESAMTGTPVAGGLVGIRSAAALL